MKLLHQDIKKGVIKALIEQTEDLWYLSHIIDSGDSVRGSTERKLKIGGEDARNQKVVRKKMTLTLIVEKVEYGQEALRVLGTISDGPDDVARGEHHSFNFVVGEQVTITKKTWAGWQIQKLKEAAQDTKEKILVVLFDRESALFALLSTQGHKVLSTMKGDVQKKGADDQITSNFWKKIAEQLRDYDKRYQTASIIAASPAFWKDYVKKEIGDLASKIVFATVSDTDENALNEVVKRPELKVALAKDRSSKEMIAVEGLLSAVAKDKAAYGIDEIETKANEGALKNVLVSDEFLMKSKEDGNYERVDAVLKAAEVGKASIIIITTEDATKQIDGLGGIAGILRW